MSAYVRQSKFRHVYCDAPKPEACFLNLRLSTTTGEQNYIKANNKFFAVGLQGGGGPFAVIPLNKPGRYQPDNAYVIGHSAPVLDFDFNPFDDHILASASEDQSIKLWSIPEEGLTENLVDPACDLFGHTRKVTCLRFHPTANNVLLSASADLTVKVWDCEKSEEITTLEGVHDQLIQDIVWDYTGSKYITSSKDKNVRFIDGRSATVSTMIETAHDGTKAIKLNWLGDLDLLLTVGSSRQMRQFKIWDPRNMSKEVKKVDVDQGAGTLMPFYDADTSVLYLAGKGDGNIRYYEILKDDGYCFPLSEYRSNVSAKGMAFVAKRGLNLGTNEVVRLLKLTSTSVEPLSFNVPRKAKGFQEDLYPDTPSSVPVHTTASAWIAAKDNLPPKLTSLKYLAEQPVSVSSLHKNVNSSGDSSKLVAELDAAKAKISELTSANAALESENAELKAYVDELSVKISTKAESAVDASKN
jgi:coronin-1B/1C/6